MSLPTVVKPDNDIETLESRPNTPLDDTPQNPPPIAGLNYDMLYSIFKYLDVAADASQSDSTDSKKYLYNTAVTCKQFLTPALDLLWRHLRSITPLLRLFSKVEVIDEECMFNGAISNDDLKRFVSYAQRVRIYSLDSEADIFNLRVSPFTMFYLPNPVLPRLRHLRCSSPISLSSHIIPHLLPSTVLVKFELEDVTVHDLIIKPFLCNLQFKVPGLEHLVIRGSLRTEAITPALGLHHLRSLELSSVLGPILFQGIASLPELRTLVVDILEATPPLESTDTTCITFLKLQTLRMSGRYVSISSYFKCMQGGQLETIVIKALAPRYSPLSTINARKNMKRPIAENKSSTDRDWWGTCLSVIICQWRSTLCSLDLVLLRMDGKESSPSSGSNFFPQISELQCLKNLKINGLRFSVGTLSEISFPTLPCIQQLFLCHRIIGLSAKPLPLSFLGTFAQRCPQLKVLQVAFESCTVCEPLDQDASTHGLKTLIIESDNILEILTSSLQQALHIAQYLDQLFPVLTDIHAVEGTKNMAFWEYVHQVVRTLQNARRNERRKISMNKM